MKITQIIFFLFQITDIILYPSEKKNILKLSKWNNPTYQADATKNIFISDILETQNVSNFDRKKMIFEKKSMRNVMKETWDYLFIHNITPEGLSKEEFFSFFDDIEKKDTRIMHREKWVKRQVNLYEKKVNNLITEDEYKDEYKEIIENLEKFKKEISLDADKFKKNALTKAEIIQKKAESNYSSITKLITETKISCSNDIKEYNTNTTTINLPAVANLSEEITKFALDEKKEDVLLQIKSQSKLSNNQNKTQYHNNSNLSTKQNCRCTIM